MNNYIPINKAVNPVCIYQGYEPLINKTLGVDEMIYGFNGTPSDYATVPGLPKCLSRWNMTAYIISA